MRACSPPLTFHRTGPLQTEIQEIDQYLKKMGVSDPSLRRRVETQLPYTSGDAVSSALAAAHRMEPLVHLNAAGRALLEGAGASNAAAPAVALVLCCDADGGGGGMESLLAQLELPALALRLPLGGCLCSQSVKNGVSGLKGAWSPGRGALLVGCTAGCGCACA